MPLYLSEMPHALDTRHLAHPQIFAQLSQNISISRLKFKEFSSLLKHFQRPHLFSSIFKGLEF